MNETFLRRWLRPLGSIAPVRLLSATVQQWYNRRPFELGAALAFYAVFSIAPILLIAIAVASLFLGRNAAQGQITQQLENTLGPTVAQAIESTLHYSYMSGSSTWATVVSLVVLLFGATGLFSQMQSALNAIWGVQAKPRRRLRRVLRDRLLSFLAMVGSSAIVLAVLLTNMALSALVRILPPAQVPIDFPLWRVLTFGSSFVFLTLAVAMIYRLLPDVKLAWRHVWMGAAVSASLALLGNYVIGLYLHWSSVTTVYGAAGSLIVILLWVYYLAQVLLFGADFTAVYVSRAGGTVEPREDAQRIPPQAWAAPEQGSMEEL